MRIVSIALTLGCWAGVVTAAEPPPSPITDRFAVRLGYFNGGVDTLGRVDRSGANGSGTPFSAERDFNLADTSRQFRGELVVRLKESTRFRMSGMQLRRRSSLVLGQNYVFGNDTLFSGERAVVFNELQSVDFGLLFSVLRLQRVEVGFGLGLHLLQTELEAAVPARASGAVRENFTGSGPFPTLAADLTWRLSPRLALSARLQNLKVADADITAEFSDYHANLQFRFRPALALGLGWQHYRIKVSAPNENPAGDASFAVSGPELFLRASF